MDALGCEQVIERPGSRGKLKLRGRSAVLGLSARAARVLGIAKTIVLVRTGRRFRNVVRRQMCETPRCSHGRPFGCADRRSGHWRRWQVVLPFGLSLPVAWLDSYGRRRHVGPWSQEFSPAGFPRKRGPRPAFLAHAPAAPKFVAPAGAQRCACPPLASGGSGSVSSSRP